MEFFEQSLFETKKKKKLKRIIGTLVTFWKI